MAQTPQHTWTETTTYDDLPSRTWVCAVCGASALPSDSKNAPGCQGRPHTPRPTESHGDTSLGISSQAGLASLRWN